MSIQQLKLNREQIRGALNRLQSWKPLVRTRASRTEKTKNATSLSLLLLPSLPLL
jgi:hypothetical protein